MNIIKTALKAWDAQVSRFGKLIAAIPDEEFNHPIAPGKNSVLYIVGHLIAVNDNMIPLLEIGQRQYTFLDQDFIKQPEKLSVAYPKPSELKAYWIESNNTLSEAFAKLSEEDWLQKHSAVSEEDFLLDPTRNKIGVLLSRTSHVAYHLGQLAIRGTK